MAREFQDDDTKRATLKHIYQLAFKGKFHNLCGLDLMDIAYLYDQELLKDVDIKMLLLDGYASKKIIEDTGPWIAMLKHDRACEREYPASFENLLMQVEKQFVLYLMQDTRGNSEYPIVQKSGMISCFDAVMQRALDGFPTSGLIDLLNRCLVMHCLETLDICLEKKIIFDRLGLHLPPIWLEETAPYEYVLYPYANSLPIDFDARRYNELVDMLYTLQDEQIAWLDEFYQKYAGLGYVSALKLKQIVKDARSCRELEEMNGREWKDADIFYYCMLPYHSDEQVYSQLRLLETQVQNSQKLADCYKILAAVCGYEHVSLWKQKFLKYGS